MAESHSDRAVVDLAGVTYRYSRQGRGIHDVNLSIAAGRTVVVGRNGSGKSTLLRVLATVLTPDSGQLTLDGRLIADGPSLRRARRRIGYLPQASHGVAHLTVRQEIDYAAWLKGIRRADRPLEVERCLDFVEIPETYRRSRRTELSGGFSRRVGIAAALVGDPTILVLDEPTSGLDVAAAQALGTALANLDRAKTVVVASHQVSEVAALADRIVAVERGHVFEAIEVAGSPEVFVRQLMAGESAEAW